MVVGDVALPVLKGERFLGSAIGAPPVQTTRHGSSFTHHADAGPSLAFGGYPTRSRVGPIAALEEVRATATTRAVQGLAEIRLGPKRDLPKYVDITTARPVISATMSDIAQAIADRQNEIDRLQAEIKALSDVEQMLEASAPAPRTSRRGSSRKKTAATESGPDAKPERKRRPMTAAEKEAVSARMTAYWAERRKKKGTAKK